MIYFGINMQNIILGGLAWKANLRPGSQVVRINGLSTARATHRMFVDYVKISLHLEIYAKNVGMMPRPPIRSGGDTRWQFPTQKAATRHSVEGGSRKVTQEPLVFVKTFGDTMLGAHVKPCSAGLAVTAVRPGSVAGVAKFMAGDEIVEVNGIRLDGLDFEECIGHLRCDSPFTVRLRRLVDG